MRDRRRSVSRRGRSESAASYPGDRASGGCSLASASGWYPSACLVRPKRARSWARLPCPASVERARVSPRSPGMSASARHPPSPVPLGGEEGWAVSRIRCRPASRTDHVWSFPSISLHKRVSKASVQRGGIESLRRNREFHHLLTQGETLHHVRHASVRGIDGEDGPRRDGPFRYSGPGRNLAQNLHTCRFEPIRRWASLVRPIRGRRSGSE